MIDITAASAKLTDIYPSPVNPRSPETDEDVGMPGLVGSIKRLGILEPLVVRPSGEIVAGHRRFVAAKLANLEVVPIVVLPCEDAAVPEIIVAENYHRADLTPLQLAALLKRMYDDGLSKNRISTITGISIASVATYLKIYQMPQVTWPLIERRSLSLKAVNVIAGLDDDDEKIYLATEAAAKALGTRSLIHLMDKRAEQKKGAMTYSQRRQTDIAKSLDELVTIRTRLESYRDLEHIPPYIQKIEGRLQSVSRDIYQLCEELVASAQEKVPNQERGRFVA